MTSAKARRSTYQLVLDGTGSRQRWPYRTLLWRTAQTAETFRPFLKGYELRLSSDNSLPDSVSLLSCEPDVLVFLASLARLQMCSVDNVADLRSYRTGLAGARFPCSCSWCGTILAYIFSIFTSTKQTFIGMCVSLSMKEMPQHIISFSGGRVGKATGEEPVKCWCGSG